MARASKKADSRRAFRDTAQQLKMISTPARLLILGSLAEGEVNIGSMVLLTRMTQAGVSHHVSLLRAAKFVEATHDGRSVGYTLTDLGRRFWGLAAKMLS